MGRVEAMEGIQNEDERFRIEMLHGAKVSSISWGMDRLGGLAMLNCPLVSKDVQVR